MALVRKGSRRIVVDGTVYRWRLRGRPTYFQGLAWSPCTFAVEHADTPGRRSWSPPTSRIRATGSIARLSLYCLPVSPRLFGLPCVRVGLRRLRALRSTSTSPSVSRLRTEHQGIGERTVGLH
jgi:hypothetical protein